MAPDARVARPPRRWPRRLLIGLNIFVAVSLVATASAYLYLKWRFGQIDKVAFECHVLRNCGDDDPQQPMNVLLVGSDSRKNITAAERRAFGSERQVGGQRSDTIIVLHIDPKAEKAAILSIPRDLYVPIGGTQRSARINTAFEQGPQTLIATIRRSLGVEIDHYAEVDFNGFRGIVNAIGGVTMHFPSPARDTFTGLNVVKPGCVELDGNGALSFVRSRHYQYYESGRWRGDPTGDIGRIGRQQDFIRRVIRKASRAGRNPVTLNSLLGKAVKNVIIDESFSSKDIFRLAKRFRSLSPDVVEMYSVPAVNASVGGASVLRMKQPEAGQILDRFSGRAQAAGRPATLPKVLPNTVRVRVLNGTGAGGQATEVSRGLQKANFNVASTGDADSFRYAKSLIRFGPGQLGKAQLLAAYVQGGAQLREEPTLAGIDLVFVTGSDFGGIRSAPGVAAPSSSTTTAPGGKAASKGASVQPQC